MKANNSHHFPRLQKTKVKRSNKPPIEGLGLPFKNTVQMIFMFATGNLELKKKRVNVYLRMFILLPTGYRL